MNDCQNCSNYNASNTYPETGYCELWQDFMDSNDTCSDHEEKEDEE